MKPRSVSPPSLFFSLKDCFDYSFVVVVCFVLILKRSPSFSLNPILSFSGMETQHHLVTSDSALRHFLGVVLPVSKDQTMHMWSSSKTSGPTLAKGLVWYSMKRWIDSLGLLGLGKFNWYPPGLGRSRDPDQAHMHLPWCSLLSTSPSTLLLASTSMNP